MKIGKIFVIAKYTLVEAVKRRFILLFAAAILLSIAVSIYGASLSMLERPQTLAAFYGFCIRLFSAGLIGSWVLLSEVRALDPINAPVFFALPIDRSEYLLGRLCGYVGLISLLQLVVALPLLAMPVSLSTLLVWLFSLGLELLIITLAASLLALLFAQPVAGLFLLAIFYLFARCSGEFWRHSNLILQGETALGQKLLAWPLNAITYLVPRLEEFAGAAWLLRDKVPDGIFQSTALQTALYALLLLALTLERLCRRAF